MVENTLTMTGTYTMYYLMPHSMRIARGVQTNFVMTFADSNFSLTGETAVLMVLVVIILIIILLLIAIYYTVIKQ